MRQNLPITGNEYRLPEGCTLLSTTNPQSHITYANEAFVDASGYAREELMGQPHNMVRHPDMPPQAFADMWATIHDGLPWTALVKNRRKDGDHYWVRANATQVRRDGRLVGYMSVRTPVSSVESAEAEALYARFRSGKARGLAFHRGLVVRTGWRGWQSLPQRLSTGARLYGSLAAALACSTVAGWAMGGGLLALAGASTVAFGVGAALLRAQIARPIGLALQQGLAVASGQRVPQRQLNRCDDLGMLLRSIQQAGLNLQALVDDVGGQVNGIDGASGEVAAGSRDLGRRTEQAASGLQQTAASMEELSASISQSAQAAVRVGDLTAQARRVAQEGGGAMQDAVERMQEISHASRRIADIVGLIDGIAFQTNILALNAAVEAARAGEQGRGFAVVAAEVRTLAGRSAHAAREIKTLIQRSAQTIEEGSVRVASAGETMRSIVRQVEQVSTVMAEVGETTRVQADGVAQVHAAVASLDEGTQRNAALVEQSTAAAVALRSRAARLAEAVDVYRGG